MLFRSFAERAFGLHIARLHITFDDNLGISRHGQAGDRRLDEFDRLAPQPTDDFIFAKANESIPGVANRDVIMDFEDGLDSIAIGAFVSFLGVNAAFNSTAGSFRVMTNLQGWVVQVDTDGNNKADFAVEVRDATHAISWDAGDFVL